jgi:hypothetical protein
MTSGACTPHSARFNLDARPLGHNEIVRISTTTGNPVSRVYPGGSCSRYCSQVYATAGGVWEPTAKQVIRINPARMPR